MKNTMLFLMIAVLLAGIVAWPTAASACSCAETPGVSQELERSDAIFSGKVISIEEKTALLPGSYPSKAVIFEVAKIWKGMEQSQVKITTGLDDGDCGFDFSVGQEYLVYAVKSEMYGSNLLSTMICDRTDILSQAQGDFSVLGEGQAPTEEVDLLSRNAWLLPLAGFIVFAVIAFAVYRKRKTIK